MNAEKQMVKYLQQIDAKLKAITDGKFINGGDELRVLRNEVQDMIALACLTAQPRWRIVARVAGLTAVLGAAALGLAFVL